MARDVKGTESDWSEPETLVVGEAGAVLWSRLTKGVYEAFAGPALVFNGTDELMYFADESLVCFDRDGIERGRAEGVTDFVSHPSYCAATGHILVSQNGGVLHAFTTSLEHVWSLQVDTGPDPYYGTVLCIDGRRVYVTAEGRLVCVEDRDTVAVRVAESEFLVPSGGFSAAPVVCPNGDVLAAWGSGYARLTPDLDSVLWRNATEHGIAHLALDEAGNIYTVDGDGNVFKVDAGGTLVWRKWLGSRADPWGIAVGSDAVFISLETMMVCLEPDGSLRWDVPDENEFWSAPVLSRKGHVYVVDGWHAVLCLRQDNGERVWSCGIDWLGLRGRDPEFEAHAPTLDGRGNLIFGLWEIVICVKGYEDGTLDTDAPWPKWQRDHHNTGNAGAP
jgi:outer membrane protein assembly factor BamB